MVSNWATILPVHFIWSCPGILQQWNVSLSPVGWGGSCGLDRQGGLGQGTWAGRATGQEALCMGKKRKDSCDHKPGAEAAQCHRHAKGVSSPHTAHPHQLPFWKTAPGFAPQGEKLPSPPAWPWWGSSVMKRSHLLGFFTLGSVHGTLSSGGSVWTQRLICCPNDNCTGELCQCSTNHQFTTITHLIWVFFSWTATAV